MIQLNIILLCYVEFFFKVFAPKKRREISIFVKKWLDNMFIMTLYLVNIATNYRQT